MLIDSHCHLTYDKPEWGGLDALIKRAYEKGVGAFLTVGCSREDFKAVREDAESHNSIFFSVGIHPHEAEKTLKSFPKDSLIQELKDYLDHPKAVAIGETGLDYYYEHSPKNEQRDLFQSHIELSLELDIPLIVHTRDAEKETIELLRDVGQGRVKGVIHCFSGSEWLMKESLDLGLYISVSGILTFKKAEDLRHVVSKVPLDRLLVETDAPYLAPIPYRGKVNEPSYVVEIARALAELKGVSYEKISQLTTENCKKLFSKMGNFSHEFS